MNTNNNVASPARQMESLKVENLLINFTTEFYRIWDSRGSKAKPGAFWRATPAPDLLPGFFPLGDIAVSGYDNINGARVMAVVCEGDPQSGDPTKGKALSQPVDYEHVWKDSGSGSKADVSIWRPIPPDGYEALGLVCSNDHAKPSLNAVRCVRADLVIGSSNANLIWSDKGSGAKQDFSAWSVLPPVAGDGEIHLAPGTFVGIKGYSGHKSHIPAYSLKIQIPLQVNSPPAVPILSGEEHPSPSEPANITHIAKLPWFTVQDPDLTPLEQFRASPFYLLERTDQYFLVGYGHNTENVSQTFRWIAPRSQRAESLKSFADITSIEFASQWPTANGVSLFTFSARLNNRFAHTETRSDGWFNPTASEVITIVAKNKAVAAYQVQSEYRLLREDGTQLANSISYTDGSSLHVTEYPPEKPSEVEAVAPSETDVPAAPDDLELESSVTATPLPAADLSTARDTAP